LVLANRKNGGFVSMATVSCFCARRARTYSVRVIPPVGWPVVDRGLFMAYVGQVLVVHMDGTLSDAAFARYRSEWLRAVDVRPADAKMFALYQFPEWPGITAGQRKQWAEMLASRGPVLKRTTVGMALATGSVLARGAVRAIYWVSPPPFPYAVVETSREGFEYFRGLDRALDAAGLDARYQELRKRHRA
jgi:hypothetical protein